MISDVLIYEDGNGGELVVRANDLVTITGYENAPYLSMFGGSDWALNYLVPDSPYESKTEETLRNTPLTSSGRLKIQDAMISDLSFLNDIEGTKWSVDVTIVGVNRLSAVITINGQQFNYSWDPDELFLTYQV
jgi:hypothetical protein